MASAMNYFKIILTAFVIFFGVQAQREVQPIYCHLDNNLDRSQAYSYTPLKPQIQYKIYPYVRDEEDAKNAINCTWRFTVQTTNASQSAAAVLLELRRKEDGQVMAGDSIRNLTVSVSDNGTVERFPFITNISRVLVKSGNTFTIRLSMDNTSAQKMDNSLFIEMSLVTDDSCPSGGEFQQFGHSCITVRNASFICGNSTQLDNCSLMTNLTVPISSTDELTEVEEAKKALIIGIVVAVCAVCIIVLVCIIAIIVRRRCFRRGQEYVLTQEPPEEKETEL